MLFAKERPRIDSTRQQRLLTALSDQASWCAELGSALYSGILTRMAEDVRANGPVWASLEPYAGAYLRSLLPLRFLAALHRMALEGSFPQLARFYPSCGGEFDIDGAWSAILFAIERDGAQICSRMPETVQTNEISRCCGLMLGFTDVARQTGLPLRLLEVGCSAGLNLRWDQYRYETGSAAWGPRDSSVVFRNRFAAPEPLLDAVVKIAERRGCDLNPIEPTQEGQLLALSYVWPDQTERFEQISNAFAIARKVGALLDRSDALDWMAKHLAQKSPGVATVLFHSVVWFYFSGAQRDEAKRLIFEAGTKATEQAPLAWLSMERAESKAFEVRLTLWPGGQTKLIGRADPLGKRVETKIFDS